MNIQQHVGSASEKDIAKLCKSKGYWVHRMPTTTNGQSVDFIIVKGEEFYIFDCKHVSEDKVSFTFGRIESNQEASLNYMVEFAKISPLRLGFAIYFERIHKYLWLPYMLYKDLKAKGEKSCNMQLITHYEFEDLIG